MLLLLLLLLEYKRKPMCTQQREREKRWCTAQSIDNSLPRRVAVLNLLRKVCEVRRQVSDKPDSHTVAERRIALVAQERPLVAQERRAPYLGSFDEIGGDERNVQEQNRVDPCELGCHSRQRMYLSAGISSRVTDRHVQKISADYVSYECKHSRHGRAVYYYLVDVDTLHLI